MIRGIGVDILSIDRIDFKIAKKVLSQDELEVFDSISNERMKREYLAERFAVKEALFKADNSYFNYDKISILNDEKGNPFFKDIDGFVSISHDNGMVCAFVVLN